MHMISRRSISQLLAGLLGSACFFSATAQSFPSKTVNLVVPYPAGGPSDFVARQLQPELSKLLAQTVIVDNVGGVAGALGVQKMLAAPHDGHSLILGTPMAQRN